MSYENRWGINKYYGEYSAQHDNYDEQMYAQAAWQNALSAVNADARNQVVQAKDKWNSRVRELLRNETGLKFLRNDFAENKPQEAEAKSENKSLPPADESLKKAPIKIVDGFPPPLAHYFENIMGDADILLRRQDFEQARTTLEFAGNNFERLRQYNKKNESDVSPQTLLNVSRFLEGLIIHTDEFNLIDRILAIDEDCLGAYFFRRPEIHIYWLPIAILAQSSPVADIESLTFIILSHELAHAYTHQGKDIDGNDWNTEQFAQCDTIIVEGIAQYYTLQLCKRMRSHSLRFEKTFNWMLEKQSEPYTRFGKWIEKNDITAKSKQHGEVIRDVMMQARRKPIEDLREFEYEINESKQRLERKK